MTGEGAPVVLLHGFPDSGRQLPRWSQYPEAAAFTADLERDGSLTPRPQLVPSQPGSEHLARAAGRPAARGRAHQGRVELRGHRAVGGPDGQLGRAGLGPWRDERLEGVGHWMPLEAPERVNELLVDFLSP